MDLGVTSCDELSFLHFNDVVNGASFVASERRSHGGPDFVQYHITQSTALGRLSHVFRTTKDSAEIERPVTVFSGDAFSPSLESAVMKGEHMTPILNHLLVDVACYGNHDFDFGEDVLVNLSQNCTFPWLLANAVHADGRLMATAKEYLVLERRGYRIGFFGLAGTDWPSNCQHLPVDCTILDPVAVAKRVSKSLRSTHGVDLVIAITHMRHEEDMYLSRLCDDDIDLILGGHDHELTMHGIGLVGGDISDCINTKDNTYTREGRIRLIKSGTDFRSYSDIKMGVVRSDDGSAHVQFIRVHQTRDITLVDHEIPEDASIRAILAELQKHIADRVDKPLFHSAVPLEGRTSFVRMQETNMGNMLADAVRAYYNADIAFINSGSLRCDRVIHAGVVTVKDMIDIVPFGNPFVVKRLRGHTIAEALENAACDIIDGRFVQVSGITFRIDPKEPVGARVHRVYLVPGHISTPQSLAPVQPVAALQPGPEEVPFLAENEYTVVMVAFIAEGFDGYTLFKDTPTVIDEEGAVTDSSLFLQIFRRNTSYLDDGPTASAEPDSEDRARAAIVLGMTAGGLPLVSPSVQGRIEYTCRACS